MLDAINSSASSGLIHLLQKGRYFIFYEVSNDVFIVEGTESGLPDDPSLFQACRFTLVEVQEMLAAAIALFVCR
ncbi:hypothetical protein PsorP6_011749 [Peronosclerospora sorghi]|uniref:Uncharacterized protein n=1 Tax=Peronosclerospora sorghi TaxID=230839 RepID=A0ACC0WK25_9STRA|nr:hypothetical protein PsorP6_011749 [Peronosclerospora sorghi]